jgi:hypothetical protein
MKNLIFATFTSLIFASCTPSTPQARIQANLGKFNALSRKEKESVQKGLIAPGMSADAVFLAWGAPSDRFQGAKNNTVTERWDYAGTQPVYSQNVFGFHGGGFGPRRYRNANPAFFMGPDIAYIPYRIASVWFVNHRVDSWERVSGETARLTRPIW